jgi:hypothetical protein
MERTIQGMVFAMLSIASIAMMPGASASGQGSYVEGHLPEEKWLQSVGVIAGLHGIENYYLEAGFAMTGFVRNTGTLRGLSLSTSLRLSDSTVVGAELTGWYTYAFFRYGINASYYTNFHRETLRIRPELGIGYLSVHFLFGYNFPVTGKEMSGVNDFDFGVRFYIPVDIPLGDFY